MKLFDVYPLFDVTPVRAKDVNVFDENGVEWFEDEDGYWWYREEGQDDWQPYDED